MHAAVIDANGGPEVFEHREQPDPTCADDGIVIAVEAVCVESADLIARATRPLRTHPQVLGAVAAGTVIEVGANVGDRQIGDRVLTIGADGAYATRRAVPAASSWRVPGGLDSAKAVCVPVAFGTAFEALHTAAALRSGETVLVHSGSGGVGMAAIQLARWVGATVVATAPTAAKAEALEALGVDAVVDVSAQHDLVKAIRERLGSRRVRAEGVDVVIDTAGASLLAQGLALVNWRGRLVSVGNASGVGAAVDIAALWPSNATLHGVRLAGLLRHEPARAHALIDECLARVASGELSVRIAKVYGLAEAGAAHAYIESRQAFGRVLLAP